MSIMTFIEFNISNRIVTFIHVDIDICQGMAFRTLYFVTLTSIFYFSRSTFLNDTESKTRASVKIPALTFIEVDVIVIRRMAYDYDYCTR